MLKASGCNKEISNNNVKIINFSDFDFDKVNHCIFVNPSFEHCTNILKLNHNLFSAAFTEKENEITAFCVFSKNNGAITQLGYTDVNDLKYLVEFLCSKFELIDAKNIDVSHSEVLKMLKELGFCEIARQYEMAKKLVN